MSPIEFIILFIIANFLNNMLEEGIIKLYSAITGKRIKEVTIKWRSQKK